MGVQKRKEKNGSYIGLVEVIISSYMWHFAYVSAIYSNPCHANIPNLDINGNT